MSVGALLGLLLLQPCFAGTREERLAVVQFIHPGSEHEPDSADGRSWNTDAHRRKFLLQPGRYLASLESKPVAADLVFWGEFEPPTRLVRTFPETGGDMPRHLFTPDPVAFYPHDPPLMNTDPFVFGGRFFYSICKQNNRRGPTALQRLARGSVILFGSGRGRDRFVVDTVFVVADYVDWNLSNYRERLKDVVPPEYFHSTLEPIAYEMQVRNLTPSQTFRLYIGATFDRPCEGMYSFFPCRPYRQEANTGFARPVLRRPGIITDNLTQGQRLNPMPDAATVREIWEDIARQVLGQGLDLGVHAEMPRIRQVGRLGPSRRDTAR
ncbi:MAG TPA: hypothetical protein P5567_05230 [Kiritimatiellia bacterium]|nr:hypothetical protein [Kiritimatiellia bacterium]HRZ11839.1 hypothetical protein [Kiritimatiellia bacterium]HSA17355.1 hypothetical protein [Kiritimatiellia bacterium]